MPRERPKEIATTTKDKKKKKKAVETAATGGSALPGNLKKRCRPPWGLWVRLRRGVGGEVDGATLRAGVEVFSPSTEASEEFRAAESLL